MPGGSPAAHDFLRVGSILQVESSPWLQQQGVIESFEPVALEPHGGDLAGFLLIRGDREKLNALRTNEEFLRLNNRAAQVVDDLGIITAFIGEELQRQFADFQTQASELS